MSALTTRDALVSHFHSGRDGWECSHSDAVKPCEDEADALLASGVVVDAATLADDMRAMGVVWGGNSHWLTTGTHVANLAAEVIEEFVSERSSR